MSNQIKQDYVFYILAKGSRTNDEDSGPIT